MATLTAVSYSHDEKADAESNVTDNNARSQIEEWRRTNLPHFVILALHID